MVNLFNTYISHVWQKDKIKRLQFWKTLNFCFFLLKKAHDSLGGDNKVVFQSDHNFYNFCNNHKFQRFPFSPPQFTFGTYVKCHFWKMGENMLSTRFLSVIFSWWKTFWLLNLKYWHKKDEWYVIHKNLFFF